MRPVRDTIGEVVMLASQAVFHQRVSLGVGEGELPEDAVVWRFAFFATDDVGVAAVVVGVGSDDSTAV